MHLEFSAYVVSDKYILLMTLTVTSCGVRGQAVNHSYIIRGNTYYVKKHVLDVYMYKVSPLDKIDFFVRHNNCDCAA
jgi:hypothetical protein